MAMVILDNCSVFDGFANEARSGRAIILEGDRICDVSDRGARVKDAGVIDMGGRFIMPGLIDAHFHAYGVEANPAMADRYTPQLRALFAGSILEGALRRGFTTIRDAAGGDASLAQALNRGLIDGPRLFYPGLALSQTGGHGDLRPPHDHGVCSCAYCGAMSMVVDGPEEMRKAVREQLRTGATHVKLFVSGGVLSPSDAFWMNQFSEQEIRVAVEEAETRRTYVMAHAHTNEAAIRCLRNGVRSIEHATQLDPDGAKAIADHDAFAVPTLAIIDAIAAFGPKLGLSDDMLEKARMASQTALNSLDLLRQAGAKIGFGTDLLGEMMGRQLREFRLRRDVFSPVEILRQATSSNAALLGQEGMLGCIRADAKADLLAIDGDPLEDISVMENPSRFALIMRAGKIVKKTFS